MAVKHDIPSPKAAPARGEVSRFDAESGASDAAKEWLRDNAEAIKSMNDWVDRNGLPLAKHRLF